ncbi:MAG TPA: hypothetical protein PLH97_11060 [Verrucomicrobiota bacterium]|nr:hypothetical protein [Verrucomicrobiota bacterium]
MRMRPLHRAISTSSWHCAEDEAMGFSMNVCLPAIRLALAMGKWCLTAVAITMASTSLASTSLKSVMPSTSG